MCNANIIKYLFFSLRPSQWIKNIFIFLPLIFGNKLFIFPINLKSAIAFCIFSLTASVVYLINDVFDIEQDKIHPAKRLRPIASGKVSIRLALTTATILSVLSLVLSFMLDIYFGYIIITYVVLNIVYSKILKDLVIIDVFCIGAFFLLRIMSGAIVAKVEMSHWIIVITTLLALFLGFNKRRQELKILKRRASHHRPALTKYSLYFIDEMIVIITSTIAIAYMLYTVDVRTVNEFGTRNLIYSIPFVYYGLFRYLYLIHKTNSHGDPVRILLSDKMIQLDIVLWFIVCIKVIYFEF